MTRLLTLLILTIFPFTLFSQTILEGGDIKIEGKIGEMKEAGKGETVYMCMGHNGPEKCQTEINKDQQKLIISSDAIIGLIRELPDFILIDEMKRRGFTLIQKETTSHTTGQGF